MITKLFHPIDTLLNRVSMYRLLVYILSLLLFLGILGSFFKILPYNPFEVITSAVLLLTLCYLFNHLFAAVFKVKPNIDSQFITGLILTLIIGPLPLMQNIFFLTLAAFFAMGSKYLITYRSQHIFNPATFAVVGTGVILNQGASWWIGHPLLLPILFLCGIILIRKVRRFPMIFGFLGSFFLFTLLFELPHLNLSELPQLFLSTLLSPPLLFFTFIMLTEPITSPANAKQRLYFSIFAGYIAVLFQQYLPVFYTLELALLSANLIGRISSFSERYELRLKEKTELAKGIFEFIFTPIKPFSFIPGQYLEWTLVHPHTDSRGSRRYFTIASSPTEKEIHLTVKIPEESSSFKKALVTLKKGESINATNLEGEFVLEEKNATSYVFIAGGIGITPFRSIIQYLLDKKSSYPITLFYLAHDPEEFVYDELFTRAKKELGLKVVPILSQNPPKNWKGEIGRIDETLLKKYIPDLQSPLYYVSGPQPMVLAYTEMLRGMRVPRSKIKTDYFPGYEETYTKKN